MQRGKGLIPPEVHHHLFHLCYVQLQVVLPTPPNNIADKVHVLISLPPSTLPTML